MYSREVGLLSVFFLALSFLTISEIHQAKTDGMLFLFIIICNIIIIKSINESGLKNHFKIFIISLALGILIKGPIILIFTILPLVFFSIIQKEKFLSFIWTSWGFIIFLFISIPWICFDINKI